MTPMQLEGLVATELERAAGGIRPVGRGRWSFDLVNGRRLPGQAAWQEGWLELRIPLPFSEPSDPTLPWTLLEENRGLDGVARFVHRENRTVLQAEMAISDPALVSPRLAAACESLRLADAVRNGKPRRKAQESTAPIEAEPEPAWEQLGAERGWWLTRRDDHRLGVELDAPGLMNQAFLEERDSEHVVAIELLRSAALPLRCRRAVAVFLLSLTGRLRLVRATVGRQEPEAVRLEVVLPSAPWVTAVELDLSLEALSLACRLGSREVRALGQEPPARIYLAQVTKEEANGTDA